MQIRTVAAILMWLAAALLVLNWYFKSGWMWLLAIATAILAFLLYLIPRFRK